MSDSASTNVNWRDGVTCSSDESAVMAVERRGYVIQRRWMVNQMMGGTIQLWQSHLI
mgnify:CR=1 FL=1